MWIWPQSGPGNGPEQAATLPLRSSPSAMQRTPYDLFRLGGLLAIGTSTLPRLSELLLAGPALLARVLALPFESGPVSSNLFAGTVLLHLASAAGFALLFWYATRPRGCRLAVGLLVVSLQAVLAVLTDPSLLLVLAAQLPFVLPGRWAAGWMAAQMALAALLGVLAAERLQFVLSGRVGANTVELADPGLAPGSLLAVQVLTGLAWQVFAFAVGHLAVAERRSRAQLAATHAELVCAQQQLAQQARLQERLRIARELHDAMGHHLVALGIHLQLAQHATASKAAKALATAAELARSLLAQVRATVSAERAAQATDLRATLHALVRMIPHPEVQLHLAPELPAVDAQLAHTLLRCTQEALSNALRHAHARRIDVSLQMHQSPPGIALTVRDDGQGALHPAPGSGLQGMQERVQAFGGRMHWFTHPGQGFGLNLWFPVHGAPPVDPAVRAATGSAVVPAGQEEASA